MEAKMLTGNETIVADDTRWDLVATLSDKLYVLWTDLDVLTLAAERLGEDTGDLLAMRHLAQKAFDYYRERANALIPIEDEVGEGDEE